MTLAKKLGTDYLEFGIFLGLTSTKVRQIIHDNRDVVPINFTILEIWRESMTRQKSVSVMYDHLCKALLAIERNDLEECVRSGECLYIT